MEFSFFAVCSSALMLFLVMDPVGNLPLFVSLLRRCDAASYRRIIIREALIALGILLLFLFFGEKILQLLQVSQTSLGIAGGVILLMIALKMVFGAPVMTQSSEETRELFIVPLAVPLIAGPSAIATVILAGGKQPLLVGILALMTAWVAGAIILLGGRLLARLLGARVLEALESLMGFLLAVMAVEMLINGIRAVIA